MTKRQDCLLEWVVIYQPARPAFADGLNCDAEPIGIEPSTLNQSRP